MTLTLSADMRPTAGVLLLTLVAVEYGGWFMLRIVWGDQPPMTIQQAFFRAGVPMLPVVRGEDTTRRHIVTYSVLLTALSLSLFLTGAMGWLYLFTAVALGVGMIACATWLAISKKLRLARAFFWLSNDYLGKVT